MNIKIRFNTESQKDPASKAPEWRVLVDGAERLARNVRINVKSWTTKDEIAPGVTKWHITCVGTPSWDDATQTVTIR